MAGSCRPPSPLPLTPAGEWPYYLLRPYVLQVDTRFRALDPESSTFADRESGLYVLSQKGYQVRNTGWQKHAEQHKVDIPGRAQRKHAPPSACCSLQERVANYLASWWMVLRLIAPTSGERSLDSMFGILLTICFCLLYWYHGSYLSVSMNWNIVSLAIIFPISQGIGMAFKRREHALSELGMLLGNLIEIYGAMHTWLIPHEVEVDGKKVKRLQRMITCYADDAEYPLENANYEARKLFDRLLTAMICYFDIERWGRARQSLDCVGRSRALRRFFGEDALELLTFARKQHCRIDHCIGRLQKMVQKNKHFGLDGGQAHRLDQYVSKVRISYEKLVCVKEYRTPQAFRAFARVYILIVGALYGPYYVHLAKGDTGEETNIGLGIFYACLTQFAMSGLLNVMLGLEDVFARHGGRGTLDSIHVPEMFETTRQQLYSIEMEAKDDWWQVPQHETDWDDVPRSPATLVRAHTRAESLYQPPNNTVPTLNPPPRKVASVRAPEPPPTANGGAGSDAGAASAARARAASAGAAADALAAKRPHCPFSRNADPTQAAVSPLCEPMLPAAGAKVA